VPDAAVEEIRARHEAIEREVRLFKGVLHMHVDGGRQAHADRATLLDAYEAVAMTRDAAQEMLRDVIREHTALRAQHTALVTALTKIRADQGKVCANYEHCTHEGCQSSYAAWVIADTALGMEGQR
jgi:hypothetical protein